MRVLQDEVSAKLEEDACSGSLKKFTGYMSNASDTKHITLWVLRKSFSFEFMGAQDLAMVSLELA